MRQSTPLRDAAPAAGMLALGLEDIRLNANIAPAGDYVTDSFRVGDDPPAATPPLEFGLQSTGEGARPPERRIVQMTPACYDYLYS
jgi:hypothetical protein